MPVNITMPALSPTMESGTLAKWLVKEGDEISAGDVIAEIETDKATMEVEAVDEGVLGKILVAQGTENVPVNDVIAILLEEDEGVEALDAANTAPQASAQQIPAQQDAPQAPQQPQPEAKEGARLFASPLARRIAADKGVDLSTLSGTGPRGRIVKADVEKASSGAAASSAQPQSQSPVAQVSTSPAPSPMPTHSAALNQDPDIKTNIYGMAYKEVPNNNIKKVTAKRLLESKQSVPHFYLTIECELDALLDARAKMNAQSGGDYKLSVNDFIIKASAMALQSFPAANVSWNDDAVHQFIHSDISVAVATPTGLITPIIRQAEQKGMRAISDEMKALAAKAKDGKLKPEEFQGGSFSISNLGMFGVKEFSAIINPPQSCILAVGAGEQKPVVIDGKVEIRTIMSVTLSTDHRSVDGAVGAQWLQHFKRYIENPVMMLV